MYERFTDRARKVMQLANQEAQRFYHEYIGTEHILLGLIKEGGGNAIGVLRNLEVELPTIRHEVERLVSFGPEIVAMGRLPSTPRAKKVIEFAMEESRNLFHNYFGTEHLLLGLLREQEGLAAQVLMSLGLNVVDVRQEVINVVRGDTEGDNASEELLIQKFSAHPLVSPLLKLLDRLNKSPIPKRTERVAILQQRAQLKSQIVRICEVLTRNDRPGRASNELFNQYCVSIPVLDTTTVRKQELDATARHLINGEPVLIIGSTGSGRQTLLQAVARELYFRSVKVKPLPILLVQPNHLHIAQESAEGHGILGEMAEELAASTTHRLAVANMHELCDDMCDTHELSTAWKHALAQLHEAHRGILGLTTPEGHRLLERNWSGLIHNYQLVELPPLSDAELLPLVQSRLGEMQRWSVGFEPGFAESLLAERDAWLAEPALADPGRVMDLLDATVALAQEDCNRSELSDSSLRQRELAVCEISRCITMREYEAAKAIIETLENADQAELAGPSVVPNIVVGRRHLNALIRRRGTQCN